ncbi:MAG: ecdysteroid 22-kinase family protein [Saprospiraceae bacterium]|nr:ecdysteroid 22-kinase family protein [Saprospiraceae bacterium]
MHKQFENSLLKATGAKGLDSEELIQSLWSGYGKILRCTLQGGNIPSVVVKIVQLPKGSKHPRGWNTDIGHQRKLRSYEVEKYWYENFAKDCSSKCRVPKCFGIDRKEDEILMILEDLNQAGFPLRKTYINWNEITICLQWLAQFHAQFMQRKPQGLWHIGCYWHLDTRPDEWNIMDDPLLKKAAKAIDKKLSECKFKTIVHGDAKLANFCFSEDGLNVAAVDFQYVGGGCGMKDVAYFLGSCMTEQDCEKREKETLAIYFESLRKGLSNTTINTNELELEWRSLYHVAIADFHRFLKGWSPGHWKINSYSERISRLVCNQLLK